MDVKEAAFIACPVRYSDREIIARCEASMVTPPEGPEEKPDPLYDALNEQRKTIERLKAAYEAKQYERIGALLDTLQDDEEQVWIAAKDSVRWS